MSLRLSDFQYHLPEELIAQEPALDRDGSRLMVLDRNRRSIRHRFFSDLSDVLPEGGLLVINDARVVPARLFGTRPTGGRVEVFILEPPEAGKGPGEYVLECLTRPARRMTAGSTLDFGCGLTGEVVRIADRGRRHIRFLFEKPVTETLEAVGAMPLPPYIRREDGALGEMDRDRYQTIYAASDGAVAAPTAGLHFTPELFDRLAERNIEVAKLTLYVGYGTFAPVREEEITRHRMHSERVELPESTVASINKAKAEGRPVIAVGTTVVRSLEYAAVGPGGLQPFDGNCDLFIYPGYTFRVVDHLITNFHLPGSTLIMLVSALAGREYIMEAYAAAVTERYRFFSYGDAMLIL